MYLTHEWHSAAGKIAEVMLQGQLYRRGWVDAAMPDGSGLWLAADGVNTREFIEMASGYQLWTNQYPRPGTIQPDVASPEAGAFGRGATLAEVLEPALSADTLKAVEMAVRPQQARQLQS